MDLKSLRKLESLPASSQVASASDDERVTVLVKLRKGFARPAYISFRGEISNQIVSADIKVADLALLEADPSVESVSLAGKLPLIT